MEACLGALPLLEELKLFGLEIARDETLGVLLNERQRDHGSDAVLAPEPDQTQSRRLRILWLSGTVLSSGALLDELFRGLLSKTSGHMTICFIGQIRTTKITLRYLSVRFVVIGSGSCSVAVV